MKKCGHLGLRYCKDLLHFSVQAFYCQFIQTELFILIKQNISLNWMFSVDAHCNPSDPALRPVIRRIYENMGERERKQQVFGKGVVMTGCSNCFVFVLPILS
jgi:hypothetical protein